jgi:hypothetical protein
VTRSQVTDCYLVSFVSSCAPRVGVEGAPFWDVLHFAPRIDSRLVAAAERLDNETTPIAETNRRVGAVAAELGLLRPSYEHHHASQTARPAVVRRRCPARHSLPQEASHRIRRPSGRDSPSGPLSGAGEPSNRLLLGQFRDDCVAATWQKERRGPAAPTAPRRLPPVAPTVRDRRPPRGQLPLAAAPRPRSPAGPARGQAS